MDTTSQHWHSVIIIVLETGQSWRANSSEFHQLYHQPAEHAEQLGTGSAKSLSLSHRTLESQCKLACLNASCYSPWRDKRINSQELTSMPLLEQHYQYPFESLAAVEEAQDQTNIGSKSLRIGSNLQHNAFEVPYLRFFATPTTTCNLNKSWILLTQWLSYKP